MGLGFVVSPAFHILPGLQQFFSFSEEAFGASLTVMQMALLLDNSVGSGSRWNEGQPMGSYRGGVLCAQLKSMGVATSLDLHDAGIRWWW